MAGDALRVLFVCLGNICRSPTAEAVMKGLVDEAGLAGRIEVESAGTGDWHVGKPADPRAVEAAAARGVELNGTARQVDPADFERFDLLIAMDRSNRESLEGLPGADRSRIMLMREATGDPDPDVPDPYYGGDDGFERVLDILDRNCRALLDRVAP